MILALLADQMPEKVSNQNQNQIQNLYCHCVTHNFVVLLAQ